MKQGTRQLIATFVVPALVSAITAFIFFQALTRERDRRREDRVEWLLQAADLIEDRYFEPVDRDQLVFDAIRGMARRDRYSDYVDPNDYARFIEENEGHYVGVGFAVYGNGEPLTVLHAFPGSPADAAGLEPGDRITAVDGEPTAGRSIEDVTDQIKCKDCAGTPVTFTVQPWHAAGTPAPAERVVTIARADVDRPSVVNAHLLQDGLAYARLTQFQRTSTKELEEALDSLSAAGMKALILDLRQNRGGLLDEAVGVTSLFIANGEVVRTRGRAEGTTEIRRVVPGAGRFADLPLALLVDGSSASASEIVAGALQDYQRALLIGTRTFGKGMVQSVIEQNYVIDGKPEHALLKIVTAEYVTPAGRTLETLVGLDQPRRGGLLPDLVVPIPRDDNDRFLAWLADSEVSAATWATIHERLGVTPRAFDDPQLAAAQDALRGKPVFSTFAPRNG